jgi:uncharacterized protein DUF6364
MNSKLTISIDENVISQAKNYARKNKRSLSSLIENYLKLLAKDKNTAINYSPRIAKLKGSIKVPDDFDYKSELGGELYKKYSR